MSRHLRSEPFDGPQQIDVNDIDDEFGVTRRRAERLRWVIEHRQFDLHVVLEDVHDPHNVSAVLRTCDAVGVGGVHLVYQADAFPRLGRSSSASAYKWMDIVREADIESCYRQLRQDGLRILATNITESAVGLYDCDLAGRIALVFGNEHSGLSTAACGGADGNVLIPMFGVIQSLNISVACAVTLYEAVRQRIAAGLYDQPQLSEATVRDTLADWTRR